MLLVNLKSDFVDYCGTKLVKKCSLIVVLNYLRVVLDTKDSNNCSRATFTQITLFQEHFFLHFHTV